MDIRPPRRNAADEKSPKAITPAPLGEKPPLVASHASKQRKTRTFVLVGVAALLIGASLSTAAWYSWAVGAPSSDEHRVRVVVEPGDTATGIAETLHDHKLIRSKLAFNIYTQLTGTRTKLQAGGYVLSPNQDVSSIVNHMVSGETDEIDLTIPPGLTLDELRKSFFADGFSEAEIDQAFGATYDHPLLASRPAGADLEGYIYPETYRMNANQTLSELLERSFDQFYKVLQEKKLLDEYQKRGLSIHQAITLASIVQKEVTNPPDQKQVAQVFLKRLSDGMVLGSDVTFIYAAKQLGVEATPGLDSPYNTRKVAGLPPGPIANMNPSALEAVAFPAGGDYLYFVAGDGADAGKTFFARTEDEHQANIAAHCHTLCN